MKMAVIAYNYNSEHIRLQPWLYLHNICKQLQRYGNEIVIVSDGYPDHPKDDVVDGMPVIRLRQVKHFPPGNFEDIKNAIEEIEPDSVLWLMGLTCYLQRDLFLQIKYPIIALIGSPIYWRSEILRNLGFNEICENRRLFLTDIIGTLSPRIFLRSTLNVDNIKWVLTKSEKNKRRLEQIGVYSEKIVYVPPGTDPDFFEKPSEEEILRLRKRICENPKDCLVVCYFGPPQTYRGLDTLLYGVKKAVRNGIDPSQLRLVLLIRMLKGNYWRTLEKKLLVLLKENGLENYVEYQSGFLSRNELKTYIASSDIVALPFKHVISDVPISIMEASSLGIPVISSNVAGIPDILGQDRGFIISPGDETRISEIILEYSSKKAELNKVGEYARIFMRTKPTWEDSAAVIQKLSISKTVGIEIGDARSVTEQSNISSRLMNPLISFSGVDGSGKTVLAKEMVNALNQQGYFSKYVWFRFPYLSTYLILLFGRVFGYTHYRKKDGKEVAIHIFNNSLMRNVYPIFMLIDTIINYFVKIKFPQLLGYIIVCDRWLLDIVVDISVDIHNPVFLKSFLGRVFMAISRKSSIQFLTDAPDNLLDKRRPESFLDPYTRDRRKLYRQIGRNERHIVNIDSSKSVDINLLQVRKALKDGFIDLDNNVKKKIYANVQIPLLRTLLQNPFMILASNWAFQGILMATWTERIFRFGLDVIFSFIFGLTIFRFYSYWLFLGFLLSHTMNWLFNSNLVAILKFLDVSFSKKKNDEYILWMTDFLSRWAKKRISKVILMGSYSREESKEGSDIDMRLIRSVGLKGFIFSNLFTLFFRSNALLRWIPLDLFILDNDSQLNDQMRLDEHPITIYDASLPLGDDVD